MTYVDTTSPRMKDAAPPARPGLRAAAAAAAAPAAAPAAWLISCLPVAWWWGGFYWLVSGEVEGIEALRRCTR